VTRRATIALPARAEAPPPENGSTADAVPRLALRKHEAAASLGISISSFERLMRLGKLKPSRVAGRVPLFSIEHLRSWLAEGDRR
jgi:hypothetical protein